MNSNELYDNLKELWEEFDSNHNAFVDKGTKASAGRARKAIGEIKKLVTEYRKVSVSECKQETLEIEMPNRAAKDKKRKRMLLNKKWAREGRTAKQHKKWLANGGGQVVNKYGR